MMENLRFSFGVFYKFLVLSLMIKPRSLAVYTMRFVINPSFGDEDSVE